MHDDKLITPFSVARVFNVGIGGFQDKSDSIPYTLPESIDMPLQYTY